jgi:DNA-binding IclR family transcriptional regulator
MTGKQTSKEQVMLMRVFITEPKRWFDSGEIAQRTSLPGSTVRHLLLMFHKFGLLERAEVFGGFRYRISPTAAKQPYFDRIQEAVAVMQM